MIVNMPFAIPLPGLYYGTSDAKLGSVSIASRLLRLQGLSEKDILPSVHWKSAPQRHVYCFGRVRCAIQPLQDAVKLRKIAPGLEGATPPGNGVFSSTEWRALPDIWRTTSEKYGDRIAVIDLHHQPLTRMSYAQLRQEILEFSEGLRVAGILPNEKVALFADNSCRWLVADQGIMAVGAIDAVRGTRSSVDELLRIFTHSDSVALVVDNFDLYRKLGPGLAASPRLKFVVLLWGGKSRFVEGSEELNFPVYTYEQILAKGQACRNVSASVVPTDSEHIKPHDIATLVYTSGTSGNPKGVTLTHANLLHQVQHIGKVVQPEPGDRFVSILPPWHMYERSCEYFALAQGIEQVYTNVKSLKEDLRKVSPDYLVSVPLVFDTLYSGIQKQLSAGSRTRKMIAFTLIRISIAYMDFKRIYEGKALAHAMKKTSTILAAAEWLVARIMMALLFPLHSLARILVYSKIHSAIGMRKAGINGGGSLAPHIDKFFEAIGIIVLNGYGLTETSPVVSARTPNNNVLGTVGKPLHGTEIKIVDPESGETLTQGTRGVVKVRGPQVMHGYYKNHEATVSVLDENGWLDTGDLGWIVPDKKLGPARSCGGNLVLDGRAKDIIVLSTGENIEPSQIEEAALQSKYIHQIMVVGQDQRRLGALIVPSKEELQIDSFKFTSSNDRAANTNDVTSLIRKELNKYTATCAAPIGPFILIYEPFSIESDLLTPTMKMRRSVIVDRYHPQIDALFKK